MNTSDLTLPLPAFSYTTSTESGTEHWETALDLLEAALADGDLDAAREAALALRGGRMAQPLSKTLGAYAPGKVTALSSFSLSSR